MQDYLAAGVPFNDIIYPIDYIEPLKPAHRAVFMLAFAVRPEIGGEHVEAHAVVVTGKYAVLLGRAGVAVAGDDKYIRGFLRLIINGMEALAV